MQIRRALAVSVTLLARAVTGRLPQRRLGPPNAELRIAIHEDPGSHDFTKVSVASG